MALSWDIRNVANHEELMTDEEHQITSAIVFMTMAVGINEITEKTLPAFIGRAAAIEAFGPFYVGPQKEDGTREPGLTIDMIRRRIGLRTNASPKSNAQFTKDLEQRGADLLRNLQAIERAREAQVT